MANFFNQSSSASINNSNVQHSAPINIPNRTQTNSSMGSVNNEEDQLNQINLQALKIQDPYISKIIDQAQRVCVYKFIAERRQWVKKELEGTLFVYERLAEPLHGFVILSTVSRETFVQIIKPSMEFKHSTGYEAFLQYKVDVGDIYGIWFISKTDCPHITECLTNLTLKAKEREEEKTRRLSSKNSNREISTILTEAQRKFTESKMRNESENERTTGNFPPMLKRLFTTPDNPTQQQRILQQAMSVEELEKQFLEVNPTISVKNNVENETIPKEKIENQKSKVSIPVEAKQEENGSSRDDRPENRFETNGKFSIRLMTPSDFQRIVDTTPSANSSNSSTNFFQTVRPIPQICSPTVLPSFSRENFRRAIAELVKNDEDFLTNLYKLFIERENQKISLFS